MFVSLQGTDGQGTPSSTAIVSALSDGKHDLLYVDSLPTIVINGTLYHQSHGSPNESFPFNPLASVNSTDNVYLYHQLNESIILEEVARKDNHTAILNNRWESPNIIHVPTY